MHKLYKKAKPQIEVEADLRYALKELKFYFKKDLEQKLERQITKKVWDSLEFLYPSSAGQLKRFLDKFESN